MCGSVAALNVHIDNEQIVLVYACYHLKASRNEHNSFPETGRKGKKNTTDTRLLRITLTISNVNISNKQLWGNAECTRLLFLFCKLHIDYVTGNEKGAGK